MVVKIINVLFVKTIPIMKLKLIMAFIAISLVACSSDDNIPVDTTNETPIVKHIKSITTYSQNNNVPREKIIFNNNDRPAEFYTSYNNSQSLKLLEKYYYSTDGPDSKVDFIEAFDHNEPDGTLKWTLEFDYDEQNRLLSMTTTSYSLFMSTSTDEYIYNNDGSITVHHGIGGAAIDTFLTNSTGQIIKTIGNEYYNTISEIEYSGNNIEAITDTQSWGMSSYRSYTYDMETVVKGEYLKFYKHMFGSANNMILYEPHNFHYALQYSDNYMTSESSNNGVGLSYEYEFDLNGYPVKKKYISNGNVIKYEVIEYHPL